MEKLIFKIKNLFLFIICVVFALSGSVRPIEDKSGDVNSSTLTTAKNYVDVSPKPTGLYRRINFAIEEYKSTPLDLLRNEQPKRRSTYLLMKALGTLTHGFHFHLVVGHMEDVWKWDYWCQLQPKTGKCTEEEQAQVGYPRESFYYDAQIDACQTFIYSGCDGNKNNFAKLIDCERHCKGSTHMVIKETSRASYCGLQPNAGLCMSLLQRYYYDVNANECKLFIYGGCGGNQNRFQTHSLCMERCTEDE
ncbi:hypothetical protein HW555_005689 [Spodoptera exigua]|uniref:BPTI/Kunitz inhibitor domain-containing protein n=1 Tax=Spodoptera exigua TaxID=7107 RepID=A0A835L775_SPOEX|nr:hypothetical protein HW555_005689 [Spodoptera exigua]